MNQHIPLPDQWAWWRSASSGNRQPLPTNQEPQSGYYRDRARAVAIWREEGRILHSVTAGPRFAALDTLNDAFGRFCMTPITEDVYFAVAEGAPWPEDPAPDIAQAQAGIGHNSGLPHEIARDELAVLADAYRAWLAKVGGKIATAEQDAKAEQFRKRVLAFEKEVAAKHRAEKIPFEQAVREIDGRWITGPQSIKAQADALKRAIGADVTPYRVEQDRIAAEARRKAEEEREARRQQQVAARLAAGSVNAPPLPVADPVRMPVKPATSLRPYHSVKIIDIGAVFAVPGIRSDPDVVAAIERAALRMLKAKAEVAGAELVTEMRV